MDAKLTLIDLIVVAAIDFQVERNFVAIIPPQLESI
jgi:hypothetical protein